MARGSAFVLALVWMASVAAAAAGGQAPAPKPRVIDGARLFRTSKDCLACHNGLTTPSGQDVSIGSAWRGTMMANSSRDPYWQASIRRETIDHPSVTAEIEDECSICHMPMSHTAAHAEGQPARVFAHLGPQKDDPESRLAHDGVSCALCHQILPSNFGKPESFTGRYVIDTSIPIEKRPLYGPFAPDKGLLRIMHSVTGYTQTEGAHVRQSELCATCHTLYTTARGPSGEALGRFPEQMPFQEWQHSSYSPAQSCQSCHMTAVDAPAPIASVLAQPREGWRQHVFVGGNFFVLAMLDRFRVDLGVEATPEELSGSTRGTLQHLQSAVARLAIERTTVQNGRLLADVRIENLSGHKFPTAYPSRRAWIHFVVRDASGTVLFESGGWKPSGAIDGNANDADAASFEPHYRRITAADQVQIYESILQDSTGAVTTGLLKAIRYAKDNRLLPNGFDKASAHPDIAVHGEAGDDADFAGGSDRVQYEVDLSRARGALTIEAELLFQPIGFRWADNLRGYKAAEPARFVGYYDTMAAGGTATIARAAVTLSR